MKQPAIPLGGTLFLTVIMRCPRSLAYGNLCGAFSCFSDFSGSQNTPKPA